MRRLTLRIDDSLYRWLSQEAERLGTTKSNIARDAISDIRNVRKKTSLHYRVKEVCGVIKGPRDLSTNAKHLENLGKQEQ